MLKCFIISQGIVGIFSDQSVHNMLYTAFRIGCVVLHTLLPTVIHVNSNFLFSHIGL